MCTYQRLEVLDILDVQVSHDVEMGRIIDPATVIELGEILVIHVNLYRDEILTLVIFNISNITRYKFYRNLFCHDFQITH